MTLYEEIRDADNILSGYKRVADNASIPLDSDNSDYQAVLKWISDGNIPDPDPSWTINASHNRAIMAIADGGEKQMADEAIGDWAGTSPGGRDFHRINVMSGRYGAAVLAQYNADATLIHNHYKTP